MPLICSQSGASFHLWGLAWIGLASATWRPDRLTWEWGGGKALVVCTVAWEGVSALEKLALNVCRYKQVDDGTLVKQIK